MATANSKAKQPVKAPPVERPTTPRARLVVDLPDGNSASEGEEHQEDDGDEMIMVNVPRGFRLTLDNGVMVAYKPGAQSMPASHAEHWYSKAFGVTIAE